MPSMQPMFPGLIRKVEPDSDQYRATEAALAHYLDIAKLQAAAGAPPLLDVAKPGVSPGGAYAAAGELLARLQLEGDAPGEYPFKPATAAPVPPPPPASSKTLRRQHRFFQRRQPKQSAPGHAKGRWPGVHAS